MLNVLVTGGAGYIGSHTVIALINEGFNPIIIDNFDNSSPKAIDAIEDVTKTKVKLYEGDVRDSHLLNKIFSENNICAVIHFAGLKAVAQSVKEPVNYYDNNLISTIELLKAMISHNCQNIIFSSSATVYSAQEGVDMNECAPVGRSTNPYGTTKYFQEVILEDVANATNLQAIALRYFNPLGAHESGKIGEDPDGIPNNLAPYITQVAVGKLELLTINGNDYNTEDGTCVRDYIHVMDLGLGHVLALKRMLKTLQIGSKIQSMESKFEVYNLGTGRGSSVLEVIAAFEKTFGFEINKKFGDRRDGDIATSFAVTDLAKEKLGFEAQYTLDEMCRDSWNWQKNNPQGFH